MSIQAPACYPHPLYQYNVAHHIGEEVSIKAIDQPAKVTQICIAGCDDTKPAHVTFHCVWFAAGVRQAAWLEAFEIEPDINARTERFARFTK